MEEKKISKGIICLIVVLILVILGLIGYIVYDKVIDKDDKKVNTETDELNIVTKSDRFNQIIENIPLSEESGKIIVPRSNKDYNVKIANNVIAVFSVDSSYNPNLQLTINDNTTNINLLDLNMQGICSIFKHGNIWIFTYGPFNTGTDVGKNAYIFDEKGKLLQTFRRPISIEEFWDAGKVGCYNFKYENNNIIDVEIRRCGISSVNCELINDESKNYIKNITLKYRYDGISLVETEKTINYCQNS